MADTAIKRILRDVSELESPEAAANWGIRVQVVNDEFCDLIGEIAGPPDTPYEGGSFSIEIKLSYKYPFISPKVRFITKVWHPNINSETGEVCFEWSPAMSLRPLLLNLQALLATALPDDPQDALAAQQYKDDPEKFKSTARRWAEAYAGAPITHLDELMIRSSQTDGKAEHTALVAPVI